MKIEKQSGYATARKKAILAFLRNHKDDFLTPEKIREELGATGVNLSLVTIYRFLDRLLEENKVVKVSNPDGKRYLYRYVALDENNLSNGKMICLSCGKVIPLECTLLSTFYDHVQKEHGCKLDYKKTVLYCICPDCLRKQKESKA